MLEIIYENAFIACNKYIKKDLTQYGAGVISSYDEKIEIYEAKRDDSIKTNNSWLKIKIPARKYLLEMSKNVMEQSEEVKKHLFSSDALQILFHDEVSDLADELHEYIKELSEDSNKLEVYNKEMQVLYDDKITLLKQLPSGVDLIQFITEQTRNKDIEITSSFLSQYGILGSIYSDQQGERVMIFNPQRDIQVYGYDCEKVD